MRCSSFWKVECLEMMPSWCLQVNWRNCGIPRVNCAIACAKDDWKGQFWGLRYCLSKLSSLLSFPVRYDVTNKIAHCNWEGIAPFRSWGFCVIFHSLQLNFSPFFGQLKIWLEIIFIVVPCCMLFKSLLYCSNSCTSLHFKTLKSHTKTKFAPTYFGLLWNHLQGVHGRTLLGYWIRMLIYSCYKGCRYVAMCVWVPIWSRHSLDQIGTPPTHIHTHTHTHTHGRRDGRNELTYNHIPTLFITNVNQHSNLVT